MKSTDFCCLATVDPKGVWSNPVYFAWDANFNVYFISQLPSRHMQNIQNDPRVAMSIYTTEQKEDAIGIQLEGEAEILQDEGRSRAAFEIYFGRAGKGEDVQRYLNDPTWLIARVHPTTISYFDTRFFGEERQVVPWEKVRI